MTPLATLSESLRPLPSPPLSELSNATALATIHDNPQLFRIVSPIDVDRFESLLSSHPNRPLVESVCRGLREGFWPFADPDLKTFPDTLELPNGPLSEEASSFIDSYITEEMEAKRYSPEFGPELLPGMYAMPIYAIPKPNSTKLRLINNHSAGDFSLNAMIDKSKVGMRPDNVQDLGRNLKAFREKHGNIPVWLFKSDVSKAYRLLPMHPLWQLKQAVKINHRCHLDRCCCFGSRGSPDIWCSFICLVVWIAIHIKGILLLLAFMDDNFSFDPSPELAYYPPYHSYYPPMQVKLLELWDELGIQHEPDKQVFGRTLTIIGFHVDPTTMTITLPPDSLNKLVSSIRNFCFSPDRRHPLREWQHLLGWINWALNIQPLLRPAIQSSYAKIAGRSIPHAAIYLNVRVKQDLLWLADMLEITKGIHVLRTISWSPSQTDITLYCDACLTGMGFWCPSKQQAFIADTSSAPQTCSDDTIFWFEALTVLAALHWAAALPLKPKRITIFTDNLNTVQMFDSLRSHSPYDLILLDAVRIMISAEVDIRVCHIAGTANIVADALSRGLLSLATQHMPKLRIASFTPPRVTLGAAPK